VTEYRLPMPISSNNAYFNRRGGGRALTAEGKAWKRNAMQELMLQRAKPFEGRAIVHIDVSENECSDASDVANREKLVTDVLVSYGVLKNDNKPHVKGVNIHWCPEITGCRVRLERA
jgi:Holliday junction resolvase RusA-like endonuclease